MRLLHLVSSLDRRTGGPVESLRQRTRALQARGHTIEIGTLDSPGAGGDEEFAVTHYFGPRLGGYGYAQRLVPWLRAHAAEFDAVVVHGLWQYHGFAAWRALHDHRPGYFVFCHGMLDPWFKRTYPLKHLKKWLYWPWAEYRVLRDARAVLFTSEEERRRARESFWLYRCNELVVNYGTGAPAGDSVAQRAAFWAKYPAVRGKRCLLFLGRVHVKKAPELIFRAFQEILRARPRAETDQLHVIMAGPNDHAYGQKMAALVRELGLDGRVTWTGMVTGDLKWGAFHAADAFVLPSHQENFGIAVVEALACAVPVLISHQINIWREIEADGVGFVAADDVAGVTELLHRWLNASPDTWAKMKVAARESFARHYHIDRAAESLVQAIERYGAKPPASNQRR